MRDPLRFGRMRMPDYQIAVALPVLARAAREWGPYPELDEVVSDLAHVAQKRGMQALLARVERQARGEEMLVIPQREGPADAGPSADGIPSRG